MTLLKSSFLILSVIIMSCCSTTKTTNTSDNANNTDMESKKMLEEGFKKGVIVTSRKEGECPIMIQIIDEETYYLDPINIAEKYKVTDGEKIWFKFNGLRMMNRCDKANPISITEIQKRVE